MIHTWLSILGRKYRVPKVLKVKIIPNIITNDYVLYLFCFKWRIIIRLRVGGTTYTGTTIFNTKTTVMVLRYIIQITLIIILLLTLNSYY